MIKQKSLPPLPDDIWYMHVLCKRAMVLEMYLVGYELNDIVAATDMSMQTVIDIVRHFLDYD